jgi:POT family proton-dependent oligopeptide transporter
VFNNVVVVGGLIVAIATLIPVVLQLRRHPRGLFILFFAEMWERFSYYGMRGLLIFYLTQHFLFDDAFSQGQYGAYTSLVYLLPLIGGFVADHYLGTRKAIAFGALLLVAGHATMAIEGPPATQTLTYQSQTYDFASRGRAEESSLRLVMDGTTYNVTAAPGGGLAIAGLPADAALPAVLEAGTYKIGVKDRQAKYVAIFYIALSLIIMGVGFLKANISSIVGQLYPAGDPRRDPGFTLYYYGINLGALLASIFCGYLGQTYGWSWGFGLAGIGMALGFIVFQLGRSWLDGHGEPPDPAKLTRPFIGPINREWFIYLLGIAGVGAVWAILTFDAQVREATAATIAQFRATAGAEASLPLSLAAIDFFAVVGSALVVGSVVVLGYLFYEAARKFNAQERSRMFLALILIAFSVVFWTLFEQAGSSLNLFAERHTQLPNNGFWSMTAAQTQSFNSGFILLLAPAFAALWAFLGKRDADPNPAMKFAIALVQVGASFMVLIWGAQFVDANFRMPLFFLAFAYLVQTTGELCLSPVGLSMVTKLSPKLVVSTMMAVWFLSSAWAQWLGGFVARLTSVETVGGQVVDRAASLANYLEVYQWLGVVTIGIGVALGVLSFALKRMAGPEEHPAAVSEPA